MEKAHDRMWVTQISLINPTHYSRNVGFWHFAFCGAAPAMAAVITNPLDVARVRMQLNGEGGAGGAYKNTFDCIRKVYAAEGVAGVQRGLTTAFYREAIQNVPRLGLNQPLLSLFRDLLGTPAWEKDTFAARMVSGAICGAAGGFVSNPAEIVKARIQSGRADYSGPVHGTLQIVRKEGFATLFAGVNASLIRCSIGTTANLVSNGYAKEYLRDLPWYKEKTVDLQLQGMKDLVIDCAAGLFSGSFLSLCMNPFDNARTRLYSQPKNPDGSGKLYSGLSDALLKTVRAEGPIALFKGLMGNVMRQGPHMCIAFTILGVLERSFGRILRRQEIETLWKELDPDRDGLVSKDHFHDYVQRHSTCKITDTVITEVCQRVHKSGGDELNYEEFLEMIELMNKTVVGMFTLASHLSDKKKRMLFKLMDEDKNGTISKQEIKRFLHEVTPEHITGDLVEAMFNKANITHSGKIDRAEFDFLVSKLDYVCEDNVVCMWVQSGIAAM